VSDSGSETEHICELIDYYLQPLSTKHNSYIKDTYHFIEQVKNTIVPDSAWLVTGGITALYTNMQIGPSIQAVNDNSLTRLDQTRKFWNSLR